MWIVVCVPVDASSWFMRIILSTSMLVISWVLSSVSDGVLFWSVSQAMVPSLCVWMCLCTPRGPSLHCRSLVLALRLSLAAFADLWVHSWEAWSGWSSLPSPVSILKQYGQSVIYLPHALRILFRVRPFLYCSAACFMSCIVHVPRLIVVLPMLHMASSSMRLCAISIVSSSSCSKGCCFALSCWVILKRSWFRLSVIIF